MTEAELRARLHKILVDKWRIADDETDYFANRQSDAEQVLQVFRDHLDREVGFRVPANATNFYRVSACMDGHAKPLRGEWEVEDTQALGYNLYLEAMVGVLARVVEVSWHVYRSVDGWASTTSYDLLELAEVPVEVPMTEEQALELAEALEAIGLALVPRSITTAPPEPGWPPPMWEPPEPKLRDHLFPGADD